jgi:hypothetical protein
MRVLTCLGVFFGALALAGGASAASKCKSNLLIVLDRSCSMSKPPNATETRSKWEIAVEALTTLTTDYQGKMRFGLILFPDETGANCEQDAIPIPVGDDNETAIVDLLGQTDVKGPCVTNIDTAMAQAATDPALKDTDKRSFVLLISDGMQSGTCGGIAKDADTVQYITDLYDDWVATYVVGFGGAVRPQSLEDFAQAGGVAKSGTPSYYQADSATELDAALKAIADVVGTDEFNCPGFPCPDGRCKEPGYQCTNGFCLKPAPDGGYPGYDFGTGFGDGGGGGGDGGSGADGQTESGCACTLGLGVPQSLPAPLCLLLLVGLCWTVSRRRRRRAGG